MQDFRGFPERAAPRRALGLAFPRLFHLQRKFLLVGVVAHDGDALHSFGCKMGKQ